MEQTGLVLKNLRSSKKIQFLVSSLQSDILTCKRILVGTNNCGITTLDDTTFMEKKLTITLEVEQTRQLSLQFVSDSIMLSNWLMMHEILNVPVK